MRIVVIGGSGHVGTFLIPRLVRAGHEVVNVTRGTSVAYADAPEWQQVHQVTADRERGDAAGTFGPRIRDLGADAVIDLICFTLDSATALVESLRGHVGHLVHCGSIWRYGPALRLPVREGDATPALEEYGAQKEAIARYLKAETAGGGLVTTSLHPGHICGPGWAPTGPLGNLDPAVWGTLAAGETLRVPGSGSQLMHHVHADDVAPAFALATAHRDAAAGEDFHITAPSALNVRGYVDAVAGWFGQEASIETETWDEFRRHTDPEFADASWAHLHRSQYFSIEKARTRLGYTPRYEPDDAIRESLRWLLANGELAVPGDHSGV
ncbi:MAG: NAD(P)-dependent oxidoreductase [Burkholderiaceae bacterium]|nr:NAD(P)-dependent oxidoreductase [Microbacteriaceae bacterium]